MIFFNRNSLIFSLKPVQYGRPRFSRGVFRGMWELQENRRERR
jgi:hypothetical protein